MIPDEQTHGGGDRPSPRHAPRRRGRDHRLGAIQRAGRRYRVNEREADWFVEEINEPNRYGITRFDVVRDLFIP